DAIVEWRVDFGDQTRAEQDNPSMRFITVEITDGDTTLVSGAPAEGQLTLRDRENRTLTLRAVVELPDGHVCGTAEGSLSIERFHQVRIHIDKTRAQVGEEIKAIVSSSCPVIRTLQVSINVSEPGLLNAPSSVQI